MSQHTITDDEFDEGRDRGDDDHDDGDRSESSDSSFNVPRRTSVHTVEVS